MCKCRSKKIAPKKIFEYFSPEEGEKYYQVQFKSNIILYIDEVPYRFSLNQQVSLARGVLEFIVANFGSTSFFFLNSAEEAEYYA